MGAGRGAEGVWAACGGLRVVGGRWVCSLEGVTGALLDGAVLCGVCCSVVFACYVLLVLAVPCCVLLHHAVSSCVP